MKIEQVNENQIRCILTKEDLEERKIKFSELTYGSEKATRLFRDVMQQANYEYGFTPDEHPLMIEAVPMQSGMIVFVITKVTSPDDYDTKISQIVNAITDNYSGDTEYDDELPFGNNSESEPVTASIRISAVSNNSNEQAAALSLRDLFREMFTRGNENIKKQEKPADSRQKDRIYVFSDLGSLIDAAHSLGETDFGESCLYKNKTNGHYYLLIYADYLTPGAYRCICTAMSDFSTSEQISHTMEAYMEEHFDIVIPEHAIQSLREI